MGGGGGGVTPCPLRNARFKKNKKMYNVLKGKNMQILSEFFVRVFFVKFFFLITFF